MFNWVGNNDSNDEPILIRERELAQADDDKSVITDSSDDDDKETRRAYVISVNKVPIYSVENIDLARFKIAHMALLIHKKSNENFYSFLTHDGADAIRIKNYISFIFFSIKCDEFLIEMTACDVL